MAASLGQVYKGRLKENGDLVAVKVQRPFVLETVTIDLYIIRYLGLGLRKFPQVGFCWFSIFPPSLPTSTPLSRPLPARLLKGAEIMPYLLFQISIDVVGLVDEWAARFFEELDYVNEGENGTRFAEMMRKDLPQVNDHHSTSKICWFWYV